MQKDVCKQLLDFGRMKNYCTIEIIFKKIIICYVPHSCYSLNLQRNFNLIYFT